MLLEDTNEYKVYTKVRLHFVFREHVQYRSKTDPLYSLSNRREFIEEPPKLSFVDRYISLSILPNDVYIRTGRNPLRMMKQLLTPMVVIYELHIGVSLILFVVFRCIKLLDCQQCAWIFNFTTFLSTRKDKLMYWGGGGVFLHLGFMASECHITKS